MNLIINSYKDRLQSDSRGSTSLFFKLDRTRRPELATTLVSMKLHLEHHSYLKPCLISGNLSSWTKI
jgi:hypothetical protein